MELGIARETVKNEVEVRTSSPDSAVPGLIPQRIGQFQSAAGCSFATVWQWAMHDGAKLPRFAPGAASPSLMIPRMVAP